MENKIQCIIKTFFLKTFSKQTQLRFQFWFRLNNEQEVKENVLYEIWEGTSSEVSSQTLNDLSDLRKRIIQTASFKKVSIWNAYFRKYAAIFVLTLLSSTITYFFTSQSENRDETIRLIELFVPYGQTQQVFFDDGSSAYVNAGSLLIYPERFEKGSRTIYLSGEASFSVAKDSTSPFIVKTNHMNIEALGTVFNVKSYPYLKYIAATLEEGSVRVDINKNAAPSTILKPNEQLIYSCVSSEMSVKSVDAVFCSSWKEGYIILEDATFDDVIFSFERNYNVQIKYSSNKYEGQSYYLRFNPHESLEDALMVLKQVTGDLEYKISDSIIYIN